MYSVINFVSNLKFAEKIRVIHKGMVHVDIKKTVSHYFMYRWTRNYSVLFVAILFIMARRELNLLTHTDFVYLMTSSFDNRATCTVLLSLYRTFSESTSSSSHTWTSGVSLLDNDLPFPNWTGFCPLSLAPKS